MKWIKVQDKLPTDFPNYESCDYYFICAGERNTISMAKYNDRGWSFACCDKEGVEQCIGGGMPFPAEDICYWAYIEYPEE